MVEKKHRLDKELRHELSKENCFLMMDYFMVHFTDRKDFHYNYYFDTPNNDMQKQSISLRLRAIIKDNNISYTLTLKIPTINKDTYLEYQQKLDEKEMHLLAYNNQMPKGEIAELTSVHGGNVKLTNIIKVNRVFALYKNQSIFFDRVTHQGKTDYEIGTRITEQDESVIKSKHKTRTLTPVDKFIELLQKFDIEFKQAERRSIKYSSK